MTDKTLALFPASLIRAPRCAAAYLPMALQRPNVFPKGDLALAIATQKLKDLAVRPTPELEALAENWQPWRAVAARILWHYYLNSK